MVVISYPVIREFIEKHPQAKDTINNWYRVVVMADWSSFHEIKGVFSNSVDAIGNDRFVFNVGGGNYRIIAMIFFDVRTVYIRFVGRHAEYDKLKDASIV
ncbi:MAG: type II toxin-antitoxin system HigB family toxin [Chitinophagaceae bacterium]|nr:type II toxin-antitoxin system HigB family toxin [Chitinophagaceae bacterium]